MSKIDSGESWFLYQLPKFPKSVLIRSRKSRPHHGFGDTIIRLGQTEHPSHHRNAMLFLSPMQCGVGLRASFRRYAKLRSNPRSPDSACDLILHRPVTYLFRQHVPDRLLCRFSSCRASVAPCSCRFRLAIIHDLSFESFLRRIYATG